ncbi:LysR family transcriptional regulator [Sulfitobacter alexandrii]|uniref:LysR family transcriptional regulator n=1 Tax=Sulfitobacter alexandrii TaxID=1917485 RepID=A0A1J0WK35_9RHOB|nr:LysR family transcriptional regulator [Sulfitobacter alexandrii]APE44684.1 LysR family transcriptional regulator [Sulfitobacter alexandrii]
MDWKSLPPLAALRAFSAFAQCGNVQAAGTALGVSHAAISQQLRTLEAHLDVALLDRSGRSMRLTPQGEVLAKALHAGFAAMIEAAQEITGARDARPLHISCTPTFAASWLMPRLPSFRAAHPEASLRLDPTPTLAELSPDGIDIAIRYGTGSWPGLETEVLMQSPMVVVAAPALVGEGPLPPVEELSGFPWLEEASTSESTDWLRRLGQGDMAPRALMQVPGNLLLDGARDGQGVAVTVHLFVARDIAAGRLRELYRADRPGSGYHLVTRPGVMRPALKDFVRWIRREAARDQAVSPARS